MNIKYVKFFVLAVTLNGFICSVAQANKLDVFPEKAQTTTQPFTTQKVLDAKTILMDKLANLDYFTANFSQEVHSDSGEILEQSAGKLAISKPNLANWHTIEPDELAIVSDGQDVWFYNPWIEQVSVYSLSAAIAKTPILLLTSKDETLWQQYTITKLTPSKEVLTKANNNTDMESFVISAKDINSQIKSLTLTFDLSKEKGNLKQLSFLDATGQLSKINLSDFDVQSVPEASLFTFVVPEGVQVDDQRVN